VSLCPKIVDSHISGCVKWVLCIHACGLFDVLQRMNSSSIQGRGRGISWDVKKDTCICMRPTNYVLCNVCGYIIAARIRKICTQHPTVSIHCTSFLLTGTPHRISMLK